MPQVMLLRSESVECALELQTSPVWKAVEAGLPVMAGLLDQCPGLAGCRQQH